MGKRRREFLSNGAAAGAAFALGAPRIARGAGASVVVVGGGFGGAAAARWLKRLDPGLEVTLVERDPAFVTCPFSNLVLAGLRDMASITWGYDALRSRDGIEVVHDEAVAVDPAARTLGLAGGGTLEWDRLVLAPGIELNFEALEGYDAAAAERMPHAWQAGPQTELLRDQLEAMPDGGVVIIVAPDNPFRCPPGPYERAALIGHYLKTTKPRSKLLIFDPKERFSKQALFLQAYEAVYPGMVQWVAGEAGGRVTRVDPAAMIVEAGFGPEKGDVVNVIPPQRAGRIARIAGVADEKGWCPVEPATMESTLVPGIHVVGDAAIAGAMPKSGTAANSQAKVVAAAIVRLLQGEAPGAPTFHNTCYSLIAPDYGISVTGTYAAGPEGIAEVASGVSDPAASAEDRALEAAYAEDWYRGITADMFG